MTDNTMDERKRTEKPTKKTQQTMIY